MILRVLVDLLPNSGVCGRQPLVHQPALSGSDPHTSFHGTFRDLGLLLGAEDRCWDVVPSSRGKSWLVHHVTQEAIPVSCCTDPT